VITMKEIQEMEAKRVVIFSSKYDFFLRDFEVDYFSGPGGKEKAIARFANCDCDEEVQNKILKDLHTRGVDLVP